MQLQMLGWKSRGLRSTDLDIRLDQEGSIRRVSLIQMPNGTGKTTTLNCLRAALTGEGRSWSPDVIKQYAPKDAQSSYGEFELRLMLDDKHLTFGLRFNFEQNKLSYTTTYGRGRNEGYHPPPELARFLNTYFVNLLVFDGELPGQLLDPKVAKAEEALDAFFQLYLLHEANTALDKHWQKITHGKSALEQKGLTRRRNLAMNCRTKLSKLERGRSVTQEKRQQLLDSNEDIRKEISQHISRSKEDRERNEHLENEIQARQNKLDNTLTKLMDQLRCPASASPIFSRSLQEVRNQLDRLKLPETTSKQFFKELEQEDHCICGRPLDEHSRQQIRDRAGQYLDQDIVGVLNTLKNDVSRYTGQQDLTTQDLKYLTDQVSRLGHERDNYRNQQQSIQQQLIDSGDEELRRLEHQYQEQKIKAQKFTELLEEMDRDPVPSDDDECQCIKWWEAKTEKAERDLAEITQTVELRKHKTTLSEILTRAHILARQNLAHCVIKEMNNKLDHLLKGHDIYVDGLNKSLTLRNQAGASLGQTLAVGYAFLTTLFSRGQHAFPFVVDAPVTALDNRVRLQVAGIIPQVCPQFVGFVLDAERSGFVDEVHRQANGDVLYLTAFRNSERNQELLEKLPISGVTHTADGVMVHGKEYFDCVAFAVDKNETEQGRS